MDKNRNGRDVKEVGEALEVTFRILIQGAGGLLSRVGLTDSKTVDTPVELNAHLTPSWGKPLSNPSFYR